MSEPSPDLVAALRAAQAIEARVLTASDDELLADLGGVEAIGRIVDGLRIAAAAEVERRSRRVLRETGLAQRLGAKDGPNLVADTARIGVADARRRIGLGAAIAPARGVSGEPLASRYPVVTAAVAAGTIGVESARVAVEAAQQVRKRATSDDVDAMVEALTAQAETEGTELVRVAAIARQAAIDPDGPPPDAAGAHRERAFRLGRRLADGGTAFSGVLAPEHVALILEALQSRRRGKLLVRTEAGGADDEQLEAEWREAALDPRTKAQHDYDAVIEVLGAGLQAEHEGRAATASVHEVVVTATVEQLEARRGRGRAPGVLADLPMPVVERMTCTAGVRLLVTDAGGEPLHLSRTRRVFSPAQKKALLIASGGCCAVPGCSANAAFLECHHVDWWKRDDGPTDVDNGVMLCPYHHTAIHAKHPPIKLLRHRGALYVVAGMHVFGDPLPRERVQRRGPLPSAA